MEGCGSPGTEDAPGPYKFVDQFSEKNMYVLPPFLNPPTTINYLIWYKHFTRYGNIFFAQIADLWKVGHLPYKDAQKPDLDSSF